MSAVAIMSLVMAGGTTEPKGSSMRDEREAKLAIDRYADTVRKICFVHLKNYSDTEDVFQEVFMKLILRDHDFESEEHEKAWLIRVTVNACKDVLKSIFHRKTSSIDEIIDEPSYRDADTHEVLDVVLRLPENYRVVVYLHYYEGYSAPEIADILKKKENTIYTWLARAREQLRVGLGGESLGA
jgi:RNA polymerase sigma-70 factor (ECF subfamily)